MPGQQTSRITSAYTDNNGSPLTSGKSYDGDASESLTIDVPASATAFPIDFRTINTKAKVFYLLADSNLTIKVNNTSTPDKTVAVLAGQAIVWDIDQTAALHPLGIIAVTSLFVANPTATLTRLNIRTITVA